MPTTPTNTREVFNQVVASSKVFKLMSEADQALLFTGFATSTDEQLIEAIKAIQEEELHLNQAQQAKLDQAQMLIELSEKLHADLKHSEKQILVSEEAQDVKQDAQTLQNIETQFNDKPTPAKPTPKKFLGLF